MKTQRLVSLRLSSGFETCKDPNYLPLGNVVITFLENIGLHKMIRKNPNELFGQPNRGLDWQLTWLVKKKFKKLLITSDILDTYLC